MEVNNEEIVELENEEIEGYDDCGSSSAKYECKEDCIIFGGPLISRIH